MIFGQFSVPLLNNIASELWNEPFESKETHFSYVEVIGAVEWFHISTVGF